MNLLDAVLHDSNVQTNNPFQIEMDGPLMGQAAIVKRAPKLFAPGDAGGIGYIPHLDKA